METTHPVPISTPPANVPDMQPLPRTSTSRTVKVSAGYGFNRTHAATSDEDDEVPCCDYICFFVRIEISPTHGKVENTKYLIKLFEPNSGEEGRVVKCVVTPVGMTSRMPNSLEK
ncbi:hypothetical protein BJ138DRAFT_1182961 [Hygrophoropsis aurantiaca]|uniref:Uncharacterized protein n=1 Tax=Hygrophoropsis aurantiaca TaxID=72124 RepID=A0ACB8A0U7_9AGAM|nr:hypothetical protein BJ138DRAFT_1182961 [Hygrophoropsis aurantiaca]